MHRTYKSKTAIRNQIKELKHELELNARRRHQYSGRQLRELEAALYALEWVSGWHGHETPLIKIGPPRS